jgi:hypothetical protein
MGRVCLAGHWQVLTRDPGGERPQSRWQRWHVQLDMADRTALGDFNNNMELPSNCGSGLAQGGGASDRDVRIEAERRRVLHVLSPSPSTTRILGLGAGR